MRNVKKNIGIEYQCSPSLPYSLKSIFKKDPVLPSEKERHSMAEKP